MRQIDADALKAYIDAQIGRPFIGCTVGEALKILVDEHPTVEAEPKWIPIKTRPMTDEERDYWSGQYGYDVEHEQAVMFDCEMPKDQQAIWIQSKCGFVYEDICENDDGMIGLEGNGDWDDIVAWMPFGENLYQCSNCGAVREQIAFSEYFCPNCGADMRGDSDA